MKEFVQSGFDKASTNEIVKRAKISKGSLFNYFNSKKDLYVYLIEYSVKVIEQIYEQIDLNETDFFKRMEKLGLTKLMIQRKFPLVFDFLLSLNQEESKEVMEEITQRIHPVSKDGMTKIYVNIDYSMFRDDIDLEKAIDIINWTMFGFGEKVGSQLKSFEGIGEEYLKEWEIYSTLLKNSFYK